MLAKDYAFDAPNAQGDEDAAHELASGFAGVTVAFRPVCRQMKTGGVVRIPVAKGHPLMAMKGGCVYPPVAARSFGCQGSMHAGKHP